MVTFIDRGEMHGNEIGRTTCPSHRPSLLVGHQSEKLAVHPEWVDEASKWVCKRIVSKISTTWLGGLGI